VDIVLAVNLPFTEYDAVRFEEADAGSTSFEADVVGPGEPV